MKIETHEFEFLGLKIFLRRYANGSVDWTLSRDSTVLKAGHSVCFNTALGRVLTEANEQK